jgi:hypothetical protein
MSRQDGGATFKLGRHPLDREADSRAPRLLQLNVYI